MNLPHDMRQLSEKASKGEVVRSPKLREALSSQVEWYTQHVRVMRNRFVHNSRIANLLPEPGSEHTIVTIKILERDETEEKFRLDQFISYIFGKFLLFAVALDKGLIEAQNEY